MTDKSFEFDSIGLAQVLSNNTLKISTHQRDYAWTQEEVSRLLTDLAAAKEKRSDYFLGTIAGIQGSKSDSLEVVDGQQRLTTTYLMLSAIRDHLIEIDRGDNIINNLDNALLNVPDRKKGNIPRLTLNTDDAEFFRGLTARSADLSVLAPTRDSHDLLLDASKTIKKWVRRVTATLDTNDVADALDGWISYIESNAQVVLLKASNGARAFKMFETLNDRGLRTSQADLVKSYLFGESEEQLQQSQVCWSNMLNNLHELDEDDRSLTFLRHLLIATRQFVRADDVYEVIQNRIHGQSDSLTFANELRRYSTTYVATFRLDSDYWSNHPTKTKKALNAFNRFNLKPMRPLVFAIAERFDTSEFGAAMEYLANLSVRLVLASQTRTGSNEQAFAATALKVFAKEIENTSQIKAALATAAVTDSDFEEIFSKAKTSNASLGRYYLRALEVALAQEPEPHFIVNEDETEVTLEHVFPKNPKDGTWENFKEEDRRKYKNHIGNLWLLQKSQNSNLDNSSFEAKKVALAACQYKLTETMASEDDWGPDNVDVRQAKLAKLAVKTWPL